MSIQKEIEQYLAGVPDIEAIPKAAMSAIAFYASHEAQMVPVLKSGKIKASDYRDILPSISPKNVEEHLNPSSTDTQEFLLCLVAISHGYFATQHCVRCHYAYRTYRTKECALGIKG